MYGERGILGLPSEKLTCSAPALLKSNLPSFIFEPMGLKCGHMVAEKQL